MRRVYRLYQPSTILGLQVWQLPILLYGFLIGMQVAQGWHPALQFVAGGALGWVFLNVSERIRERYPGASLKHEAQWMGQADVYVPGKDRETVPLVLHGMDRKEEYR